MHRRRSWTGAFIRSAVVLACVLASCAKPLPITDSRDGSTNSQDASTDSPDASTDSLDASTDTDASTDALDASTDTLDASTDSSDASLDSADASTDSPDASTDDSPDGSTVASADDVAVFVDGVLRAVCELRDRCDPRPPKFDVDDCVANQRGRFWTDGNFDSNETILRDLVDGDATLNEDEADACIAEIGALACEDYFWGFVAVTPPQLFAFPSCARAIVGARAVGDECNYRYECRSPAYCAPPARDAVDCTSTCVKQGDCLFNSDCASGEACVIGDDSMSGECGAPLADGVECHTGSSCASGLCEYDDSSQTSRCFRDEPPASCSPACGAGERCVYGACKPVVGAGEACDGQHVCDDDLVCQQDRSRCAAAGVAGDDCTHGACGRGFYCRPSDRVCVAYRKSGESCTGDDLCASGTTCDPTSGTCVGLPGRGQRCLSTGAPLVCAPGNVCDASGVCRSTPDEDGSCKDGFHEVWDFAAAGWASDAWRCEPEPEVGEGCGLPDAEQIEGGPPCVGGACALDAAGNPVCEATPGAVGDECTSDDQCSVGLACVSSRAAHCVAEPSCAPPSRLEWDPATGEDECRAPPRTGERCILLAGDAEPCADPDDRCVPLAAGGSACLKTKAIGDACTEPFECGGVWSHALCDLAQGRCVAGPEDGEPCFVQREYAVCDAFTSWCDTSGPTPTCRAYLPTGASCDFDYDCGIGVDEGVCEGNACVDVTTICGR